MIETITKYEVVCDNCRMSMPGEFQHADAAHYTAIMSDWKTVGVGVDSKRKYYCPRCGEKLKI